MPVVPHSAAFRRMHIMARTSSTEQKGRMPREWLLIRLRL